MSQQRLIFPLECCPSTSILRFTFECHSSASCFHPSVTAGPRFYALRLSVAFRYMPFKCFTLDTLLFCPYTICVVTICPCRVLPKYLNFHALRLSVAAAPHTSAIATVLRFYTLHLSVAIQYVPFKSHCMFHARYTAISSVHVL